ncbi:MAG: uL30 family ribosomal protein, partial [Rhodobiaceae bacterium]
MSGKTVRVTQTRSAIGRLGSQRQTLIGLGLN